MNVSSFSPTGMRVAYSGGEWRVGGKAVARWLSLYCHFIQNTFVIPAKAAIVCTHLCGQVRRSPIHLAPRQRGEGGARRVSVGRVRGARPLGAERLVKVAAVWLCGTAKNEATGTPLTLPLLRNGPLPLPALRARGVWAVLGRDMADQRCVNPIAVKAGTHSSA